MGLMTSVILTLTGFAITIVIFLVNLYNSNAKFKRSQELAYTKFETETRLKLASMEKELCALRESITMNREDIMLTYQRFKDETVKHTTEFRDETKHSLAENKLEHNEIRGVLMEVRTDLSFVRGKLSTEKEKKMNQ